jgi:hypothetical protein
MKYDKKDLLPDSVGVIKKFKENTFEIKPLNGELSEIEKELFMTASETITLRNYSGNRVEYNRKRENAEIINNNSVIIYYYKTDKKLDELLRP